MKEIAEKVIEEGLAAAAVKEEAEENIVRAAAALREDMVKNDMIPENIPDRWKEDEITPVIFGPKEIAFKGGLAACNWKCITSYCYPPDLAKGIGTKKPHAANSKIGHS